MLEPTTSVQYVKGIGPRLAEVLEAKGIRTVDDLLHYLPFRYEDRLNPREFPNCARAKWPPSSPKCALQACSAPAACPFFR